MTLTHWIALAAAVLVLAWAHSDPSGRRVYRAYRAVWRWQRRRRGLCVHNSKAGVPADGAPWWMIDHWRCTDCGGVLS